MLNMEMIFEAVALAVEHFEINHIPADNESILTRVIDWYNHLDETDAETLAALAIDSAYHSGLTYNDIKEIRDYYFPDVDDNISIEEIEMAQRDYLWWGGLC